MEEQKYLGADYWEGRYRQEDTPWDIGYISPPLQRFVDELTDKDLRILIPGAGYGHEAVYLHENGFTNVFVCDWARSSLDAIKENAPSFPDQHLLCQDFFILEGHFDLILEQTFFCAIYPSDRERYVNKCFELLIEGGIMAGLLFNIVFDRKGPPFGGRKEDYLALFSRKFEVKKMDISPHSIGPRSGNELFFIARKSQNESQTP